MRHYPSLLVTLGLGIAIGVLLEVTISDAEASPKAGYANHWSFNPVIVHPLSDLESSNQYYNESNSDDVNRLRGQQTEQFTGNKVE